MNMAGGKHGYEAKQSWLKGVGVRGGLPGGGIWSETYIQCACVCACAWRWGWGGLCKDLEACSRQREKHVQKLGGGSMPAMPEEQQGARCGEEGGGNKGAGQLILPSVPQFLHL